MAPPSIARHGPGASTAWYRGRAFTRLLLGGVLCLLALVYLSASSSSAASRFRQASRPYYRPWSSGSHVRTPKPKATFVVLVREHELHDVLLTLKEIQVAFNDDVGTGYDFVFLSDTTFTDYFKSRVETFLAHRPSKPRVRWGFVEDKDWKMPEHIDYYRAQAAMEVMGKSNLIPYGGSQTYRQMCRYMSYPIFEHPLVMEYDYYWRLEPHTRHFCDLTSAYEDGQWVERDPFRYMRDNGKKYAWVLSLLEYKTTVRTLMVHVHRWRDANRHLIPEQSSFDFISDDGKAYNLCHFWSNFEIADLSFYRSEAYRSFFHSLDRAGGFFYERWGDAPVHTIGAAMLLRPDEIWKVDWAGYTHPPYMTCPRDAKLASRCACDPQASFEYDRSNCEAKWDKLQGRNSTEIILDINRQRGVPEQNWTKENPVRVLPPQRLIKPPSQAKV